MTGLSGVKTGCFTPVKQRELYLRSCLMQMLLQTRRPDHHVVLINGPDAAEYDRRAIADLLHPGISLAPVARSMTTREAYSLALELLLESDTEIFFKIDSDDVYCREYIASILAQIDQLNLLQRSGGFCLNLVQQWWIDANPQGGAHFRNHRFTNGLGLSEEERARGVRVGAPPTYVFDRTAARLLVAQARRPPYSKEAFEDRAWRNILHDHGILIELVETPTPVFGYVRHSDNTCVLKPRER